MDLYIHYGRPKAFHRGPRQAACYCLWHSCFVRSIAKSECGAFGTTTCSRRTNLSALQWVAQSRRRRCRNESERDIATSALLRPCRLRRRASGHLPSTSQPPSVSSNSAAKRLSDLPQLKVTSRSFPGKVLFRARINSLYRSNDSKTTSRVKYSF